MFQPAIGTFRNKRIDLQQPICCILGITRGVELHRIVTIRHCTTSLGDGESHPKEHSPIQRFHP